MKNKISEYIRQRKLMTEARNTLTILALTKYNELLSAQTQKEQAEQKAYDTVNKYMERGDEPSEQ